jgi:hypothetical protein
MDIWLHLDSGCLVPRDLLRDLPPYLPPPASTPPRVFRRASLKRQRPAPYVSVALLQPRREKSSIILTYFQTSFNKDASMEGP